MNALQNAGIVRRLLVRAGVFASVLAAMTLLAIAANAAPPAGTPIGNTASATYVDAAAQTHTVTSNPVTTIVQQVASFTLTANGSRTSAPGGSVAIPHVLTNTGNGADAFPLSVVNLGGDNFDLTNLFLYADADANGVADNFVPLATTGVLAPGAQFHFVLAGSVPGTQVAGDIASARVSSFSTFDGAQTASNDDQVTVTGNAVLAVTKGINQNNGASPSGPYTYTLSYQNSGNATAAGLRLTDVIPAGMTYVAGSARWSVTGATPLTDADSTDAQGVAPATTRFDFNVATGGSITAQINQVPPGQSGSVTFQVNVNPGLLPQVIPNSSRFAYNDGVGNVGPFYTNVSSFTVNQVASLTFTGQTIPSALQGSVVVFTNTLTNNGNGSDVFDVNFNLGSFPAGSSATLYQTGGLALLTDSNANGIPDTGPVAPGATYDVVLRVQLPSGVSGGPYSLTKTATSGFNNLVSAIATDNLTLVTANTVDVTNNAALPGAPGAGNGPEAAFVIRNVAGPGTTSRFTLYVNNTSAQNDNFDMAASTDNTFGSITLPAGWTVTFRNAGNSVITNTGVIAPGAATLVYADVDVPAGTVAADVDLFFQARSPVSNAYDRIHDQVRVSVVRSLTLVPNNSAQVAPGGFVVYTHMLSNTGNVTEGNAVGSFVSLAMGNDQAGWSSALYWDTNASGIFDGGDAPIADLSTIGGLAPGASVRLFVQVFAPAGAPLGQLNTTTVSATTSNLAYIDPVPPVVNATDGTTVINGQLTIAKTQSMDRDCNGAADSTFTPANLAYGAIPGACIRYEITVTNVGTTPVTGVVVNDATPSNTWSWNAATASTTVGSIVVPADGATGAVTASVGVLGPGQSAVIQFSVRIAFP